MIPAQAERTVHAAETDSVRFGISAADSVHLMTILRDTLYSDKVLAVIREYSANAWDAARGTPIEATLPTHAAPVFSVRDRGPGLPHDGVMRHFTQYGASSKRASNDAVGYLGIGCKSGFAYADSFTVTSWHGGRKRVYAADGMSGVWRVDATYTTLPTSTATERSRDYARQRNHSDA